MCWMSQNGAYLIGTYRYLPQVPYLPVPYQVRYLGRYLHRYRYVSVGRYPGTWEYRVGTGTQVGTVYTGTLITVGRQVPVPVPTRYLPTYLQVQLPNYRNYRTRFDGRYRYLGTVGTYLPVNFFVHSQIDSNQWVGTPQISCYFSHLKLELSVAEINSCGSGSCK